MKIKNKNLRKYKIKKFIFFKSKLEQEIKNPEKSGNPKNNFWIFTHSLRRQFRSSRTNPRFGPSFK